MGLSFKYLQRNLLLLNYNFLESMGFGNEHIARLEAGALPDKRVTKQQD